MRKIEKGERKLKLNNSIKNTIIIIGILILMYLIFMVAPKCTEVTKNAIKFLYELDDEYITRFWIGLLALTSTLILFFFDKIKNK